MGDWVSGQDETASESAPAALVRQGFAGTEMAQQNETSAIAIAAAAKAAIEARYVLALRRPRSWDDVRTKLMRECNRPGFAKEARYKKPVGRKQVDGKWVEEYVEGLSVRFAEAVLRHAGNIYTDATSIYDDERKAIIRVTVMDLETNATIATDVTVAKTVERRTLRRGQRAIATRTNSYGDTVYIVEATDDQVLNRINALVSKAMRNGMLRLVPGDILDECEQLCVEISKKADAADPDRARKDLFDAFAKLGVMPSELARWLGHDPGMLQPAELVDLRAIYSAIRDGDTTWAAVLEARIGEADSGEDSGKRSAAAGKVDELLEKHRAKASEKKASRADKSDKAPAAEKTSAPTHDASAGEVPADQEPPMREPGEEG